jgi:hypothetical protein
LEAWKLGSLEAWKLAPFLFTWNWSLVVGDAQVGGGGLRSAARSRRCSAAQRTAVLRRRCWGSSSQPRVRSFGVVIGTPLLKNSACVRQGAEQVSLRSSSTHRAAPILTRRCCPRGTCVTLQATTSTRSE